MSLRTHGDRAEDLGNLKHPSALDSILKHFCTTLQLLSRLSKPAKVVKISTLLRGGTVLKPQLIIDVPLRSEGFRTPVFTWTTFHITDCDGSCKEVWKSSFTVLF